MLSYEPKHDFPVLINLHNDWQFKAVTDSIWHSATVPGNIQSHLLENKLIKDRFIVANEDILTWFSYTAWAYKTQFLVDNSDLLKNVFLNTIA